MGDDLSLPERESVRTPMQWSAGSNGGFSTAPAEKLWRPVNSRGPFGYRKVNVAGQRHDPASLLNWMERMISTRKECPEFGVGSWTVLDVGDQAVFGLRSTGPRGSVVAVHNLTDEAQKVRLGLAEEETRALTQVFSEHDGEDHSRSDAFELPPFGYRWFRIAGPTG